VNAQIGGYCTRKRTARLAEIREHNEPYLKPIREKA